MTRSLYLDANIFIKAMEATDAEAEIAWSVLQAVASSEVLGITSELTLAEVLPKPIADGDHDLVRTYNATLRNGAGLVVVPVTRSILLRAARIRSQHRGIRLPDAIHIATALERDGIVFLSNDRRLSVASGLSVIGLGSINLDEFKL